MRIRQETTGDPPSPEPPEMLRQTNGRAQLECWGSMQGVPYPLPARVTAQASGHVAELCECIYVSYFREYSVRICTLVPSL